MMTTYLTGQELERAFEATGIGRLSVHGHLYEVREDDTQRFAAALNVLVDNGYTLRDSSIAVADGTRIYTMDMRSPGAAYPMSFTLRLPVRLIGVPDVMVRRDYQTKRLYLTEFFSPGDITPDDAKQKAEGQNALGINRHFWVPALKHEGSRLIRS